MSLSSSSPYTLITTVTVGEIADSINFITKDPDIISFTYSGIINLAINQLNWWFNFLRPPSVGSVWDRIVTLPHWPMWKDSVYIGLRLRFIEDDDCCSFDGVQIVVVECTYIVTSHGLNLAHCISKSRSEVLQFFCFGQINVDEVIFIVSEDK